MSCPPKPVNKARHKGMPGVVRIGEMIQGTGRMRTIILAMMTLLPLPAAAFTAQNGMTATQFGPTEIAVLHEVKRGDTDYWCAAGDFAQRALGLPGRTRLWRASPEPRGAGEGIVFTLDPARQAPGSGLSQFDAGPRDGSVSVAMAAGNYCRIIVPPWD